jgi:hypothetical protein
VEAGAFMAGVDVGDMFLNCIGLSKEWILLTFSKKNLMK